MVAASGRQLCLEVQLPHGHLWDRVVETGVPETGVPERVPEQRDTVACCISFCP